MPDARSRLAEVSALAQIRAGEADQLAAQAAATRAESDQLAAEAAALGKPATRENTDASRAAARAISEIAASLTRAQAAPEQQGSVAVEVRDHARSGLTGRLDVDQASWLLGRDPTYSALVNIHQSAHNLIARGLGEQGDLAQLGLPGDDPAWDRAAALEVEAFKAAWNRLLTLAGLR